MPELRMVLMTSPISHFLEAAFRYFAADGLVGSFDSESEPIDASFLEQLKVLWPDGINA